MTKTNTFAILGFIFAFLMPLVGLILSIIGRVQTKRRGEAGRNLATAGVVISIILLILPLIAFFAYIGAFSQEQLLPERTTFTAPLPNVDAASINSGRNSVSVVFRNDLGVAIQLPLSGNAIMTEGTCYNPILSALHNGAQISSGTTRIPSGDTFIVTWDCDDLESAAKSGSRLTGTFSFLYTNAETAQTRTHTGSIDSKYP